MRLTAASELAPVLRRRGVEETASSGFEVVRVVGDPLLDRFEATAAVQLALVSTGAAHAVARAAEVALEPQPVAVVLEPDPRRGQLEQDRLVGELDRCLPSLRIVIEREQPGSTVTIQDVATSGAPPPGRR